MNPISVLFGHLKKQSRSIVRCSIYSLVILVLLEAIYLLHINLLQTRNGNQDESGSRRYEHFSLIDPEAGETIIIGNTQAPSIDTLEECNHFNCFDVYLCNPDDGILKVHLYPIKKYQDYEGLDLFNRFTEEFYQLVQAIHESPYFVDNPDEACVFIPTIDTLSYSYLNLDGTSKILASLPHWNDGKNHLIFNFLPVTSFDTKPAFGKAMIASGGFDSWSFRPQFDLPLPVYSPFSKSYLSRSPDEEAQLIFNPRHWLVMCTQTNLINSAARKILTKLESANQNKIILLGTQCDQTAVQNLSAWRCNNQRNLQLKYPELFTSSNFCLIMETAYLGTPLLSDSLMMGCIPVILMDNYVLPFQDKIDWRAISIRIAESALDRSIGILINVSNSRLVKMREQGLFIWRKYFSSIRSITLSTLSIINERLFPQSMLSRSTWNDRNHGRPPLDLMSLVNPKLSSRPFRGFTAVILTYDRVESLYQVIHRVVQAQSCVKVLVVWNNQEKEPPATDEWPKISVPLKVVKTTENKLSNRFYPFRDIETEAILAIDDDIIMLTPDELEFGFQVWREHADRIVGFPSRVHRWNNFTHKYRYESEWTNDVSMILTGAAFYHKYYNYLFTFAMPPRVKKLIDSNMNCEDIAMNFLVSNVTGKGPIKVGPRKKFRCPECVNVEMLSNDVLHHLQARSKCIDDFTEMFGQMTLKTVEYRADPVLFKDNLPVKLKKFHNIGNL